MHAYYREKMAKTQTAVTQLEVIFQPSKTSEHIWRGLRILGLLGRHWGVGVRAAAQPLPDNIVFLKDTPASHQWWLWSLQSLHGCCQRLRHLPALP